MKKFAAVFLILAFLFSCAHKPAPAPARTPPPTPAPPVEVISSENNSSSPLHPRGIDFGATIETVAFGSSANQNLPQPLWKSIGENQPDLFLFLGDTLQQAPAGDPSSLTAQYRKLDRLPEYRHFRENIPFMVTWDDQDFKEKEFIKYWSYVGNSTAFDQKGIYHAKIIGPKKKQVQLIMLDTRTFRTSLENPNKTMLLGEAQWTWLEAQLKRPAQVRIVATSIPLIAATAGKDKWSLFPQERQRFFDLLKKTKAANVVIVSGDRRQSSIAKAKTGIKDGGMLFDVTASPINDPDPEVVEDPNFEGKAAAVESFGLAQIDWKERKISLQIRDKENKILNAVSFKMK